MWNNTPIQVTIHTDNNYYHIQRFNIGFNESMHAFCILYSLNITFHFDRHRIHVPCSYTTNEYLHNYIKRNVNAVSLRFLRNQRDKS